MKRQPRDYEDFFRMEWRDAEDILKLDRFGLLMQIYSERTKKIILMMMGAIVGILVGRVLL